MDVLCRFCAEPWDHDELHGLSYPLEKSRKLPYNLASEKFRTFGCGLFDWVWNDKPLTRCKNRSLNNDAAEKAGILYDVLGSDLDAAASMLDR